MARRFPHLREIANEILLFDSSANNNLLIGRDAPELLKVREFRNGPKGAPWAQRLTLGWTITGQMCLDLAGGPVHVRVPQQCPLCERNTFFGTTFQPVEVRTTTHLA